MVQAGLFSESEPVAPPVPPNPMVRCFGLGPAGATCGQCVHLHTNKLVKAYHKCFLRRVTSGPATDHRRAWPACARFEARPAMTTRTDVVECDVVKIDGAAAWRDDTRQFGLRTERLETAVDRAPSVPTRKQAGAGPASAHPSTYRCLCGEFDVFEAAGGRCLVCLDRASASQMCTRCRRFKGAVYQSGWLCARCAGLVP